MRSMNRYLGSAGTVWRSLLSLAMPAILLFAQDDAAKNAAGFAGRVTDSVTGAAIANATIRLDPVKLDRPGYSGRSRIDGQFRFEAISPADYHIQVKARGYTDAATAALHLSRENSVLHFEAKQSITDAAVLLDPEAVVTGRVSDAHGDALPDAGAVAVVEKWENGLRIFVNFAAAQADDRGEYRLKLPAGKYYLAGASGGPGGLNYRYTEEPGQPEMRLGTAYYPGAASIEGASAVELRPGQQMGGIDFHLSPEKTYHIRGVLAPFPDIRGPRLSYLRNRNGDRVYGMGGGTIDKNGAFDWAAVRPGSYVLDLLSLHDMPTARLFQIDVTDHDVNGVRVPTMPRFEVKGHMRFEDDTKASAPPSFPTLTIVQLDWYQTFYKPLISPDKDGGFRLTSAPAREFVLRPINAGAAYVKSVTMGGQPLENGKIDFRNGASGELEIVLAADSGDVAGALKLPEAVPGSPAPRMRATRAVLVSADAQTSNTGARTVELDASGQFVFHFVPPGKWLVFACPAFDEGLWQNMPFIKEIQSLGVSLDLEKRGSQRVEVAPLTAEDIERAIQKVRP
jgi:Carboxypeptidase regulatory-like domain